MPGAAAPIAEAKPKGKRGGEWTDERRKAHRERMAEWRAERNAAERGRTGQAKGAAPPKDAAAARWTTKARAPKAPPKGKAAPPPINGEAWGQSRTVPIVGTIGSGATHAPVGRIRQAAATADSQRHITESLLVLTRIVDDLIRIAMSGATEEARRAAQGEGGGE
jgi:hypothetical protein